jgi:hypothetical protein
VYGRRKGSNWVGWLRRRRRDYRRPDDILEPGGGWCDHPETREDGDGCRYFIAHPYELRLDAMRALIAFCAQHDLSKAIAGISPATRWSSS